MEKVIEAVKNVFQIPELRNRIYFTFLILALYRLGCQVLVPGINSAAIADLFSTGDSGILQMVNMFTGGALGNAAVFALGIMPYITASIIVQILQKSIPYLERLSKEGEQGRNKLNRYTRYLTVLFALLHSFGISRFLLSLNSGSQNIINPAMKSTFFFVVLVMITLTTGAILIMWLGEKITEKGIGNGISLIIFASIIVNVPSAVIDIIRMVTTNSISAGALIMVLLVVIGTILFVVFFEMGVRRITVQYAKRVAAGGQMAGGNSYLPFKVNSAGVIPVIFSASLIQIPTLFQGWISQKAAENDSAGWLVGFLDQFAYGRPFSNLVFFIATMFFTYFYVDMLFNPKDTAENLKKNGGFIPGIRPGKETQEYIEGVLSRLTFWGGLYLTMVSVVPTWIMSGLQLNKLPSWLGGDLFERLLPSVVNNGTQVMLAATLGGTSLLIVVSVALDFVNQIENQLIMRKYDGFMSSKAHAKGRTRRYA